MIKLPLKGGEEWQIPWQFMVELNENYHDVDDELRKMRIWLLGNDSRLKTRTGIKRFIVNWLNKGGKFRARTIPISVLEAAKPLTDADRERAKGHIANLKGMLKR